MPSVSSPPVLPRPALRIPVRFAGPGAGLGELTWGQREIWLTMLRQRSWLPIGGWNRLAPGTTVAGVAAELRWIMARYQPMRTRLRFTAGGRPLQCVADRGTVGLDVYDCPDDADPEAFVVALDARDRARPYDFVEEWPVRMAVVRHRGAPTHRSTVLTHLVTDGLGGRIFLSEVARHQAGDAAGPVAGMPPLELAEWQGGAAGQRQNASALRHWERTLRRLPAARPVSDVDGPRYYRGELVSSALPAALHVLSEKTDADSSQVLMALLAVAATEHGGPAVLRPMVSNRFRRGLETVVAMVAQRGICVADVGGPLPFAEALRRVGAAAMAAYKYAYVDPDATAALAAGLGVDAEAGLWYNDRRVATRQGFAGEVPGPDELRAAPPGRFRWTVAQDDPFDPLSVDVDDAAGGAFLLTVFTDAGRLAPAGAEALVRRAEAIAVQAALGLLEGGQR
ncbi:condensation domain-containing protein [Dactylosporangium sp. NPDC051485]|uniref:condensation domain-containing protein n=1 Tax=Dactylosporangium sp. NPDC051485 TaxID=3154846 RepID=UPI00342AC2EA